MGGDGEETSGKVHMVRIGEEIGALICTVEAIIQQLGFSNRA